MHNKLVPFVLLVSLFNQNLSSQPGIRGRMLIDTAIWAPVAYLSIIPDFDNLYTISNEIIIDIAIIDGSGNFSFETKYLPIEDNLLRIHISKKGDLPASLIIGGKDENHFFLIANRSSTITINDSIRTDLIKNIIVNGYLPNILLYQVDKIAGYLDTTNFDGSIIKTELIRNAIFEKLRSFADTCSNPLVSLYALYKSKFDRNYPVNQQFYKNYLSKWKHQKSSYFIEFRKKVPISQKKGIGFSVFIGVTSFILGFLMCFAYLKSLRKKQNLLQNLSVQERKIYALILEGKSNKEISEELSIGLSTAKSHVSNIFSKLDINSRKEILNLNLDKKET